MNLRSAQQPIVAAAVPIHGTGAGPLGERAAGDPHTWKWNPPSEDTARPLGVSKVVAALGYLGDEIDRLAVVVESLVGRLGAVRVDLPCDAGGAADEKPTPASPLVDDLDAMRRRVAAIRYRVDRVESTLEV